MRSELLPPAVTHSALIAPWSLGLLAAPHQRCHVIVMREELMVKGDTTNKTSSGELSLTGRIKGQRERPARCCPGLRRQVPGTGVVAALLGLCGQKITPATAGAVQAGPGLRGLAQPCRGFSLALKLCSGMGWEGEGSRWHQSGARWVLQSPVPEGGSPGGTNQDVDLGCPAMGVPTCPWVCQDPPVPRMLLGTNQELREDLDETPASPGQEVKWFGWVGLFFGCCQQHRLQHPSLLNQQEQQGAGCPVRLLLSPGATAGHRLLLCFAAVPAWSWFAFGSLLQFPAATQLILLGTAAPPTLLLQGWGITPCPPPSAVLGLLEHTEQQSQRGKSYCCSHTPAITSQQKAASAQPGESPRTGTARVTFTGRAADRPEP